MLSWPSMKRLAPGLSVIAILALAAGAAALAQTRRTPDWIRFRGPNGSGVSTATNIPTEFGPGKNVIWRIDLPTGHSSPILFEDRVYVTSAREKTLVTY